VDISSFWTPCTTLLELVQPVQPLEVRYQRYRTDKSLLRPMLLEACRMYKINRTGIGRMRRFMLCRYIAEFETERRLPSFMESDDESEDNRDDEDADALTQALLNIAL
jgi:hypothetical protein